jgi:RecJ-like exonuclease
MATCERCGGEGVIITCCDDICNGIGHCIHGDGEEVCPDCHGEGDDLEDYDDYGLEERYDPLTPHCRWCGEPLLFGRCITCDPIGTVPQRP